MQKYLMVAIGGSLGSLARFWVGSALASRMGTKFPYGTFIVNITACFILGFSIVFLGKRTELNPSLRYFIPIGFVGAYSTFSTFEWDTFSTLQLGAFLTAGLYVALSIVLGLAAVWCGVVIARVLP